MITLAAVDSVANKRLVFNRLRSCDSVTRCLPICAPRFAALAVTPASPKWVSALVTMHRWFWWMTDRPAAQEGAAQDAALGSVKPSASRSDPALRHQNRSRFIIHGSDVP